MAAWICPGNTWNMFYFEKGQVCKILEKSLIATITLDAIRDVSAGAATFYVWIKSLDTDEEWSCFLHFYIWIKIYTEMCIIVCEWRLDADLD